MNLQVNSTKHLKQNEQESFFLKLFQRAEDLQTHSMRPLSPYQSQKETQGKLQTNIPCEIDTKMLNKIH